MKNLIDKKWLLKNVSMVADRKQESGDPTRQRNNYLIRAMNTLDGLVEEWFENGMKKADVSAPKLAAETGINYNTWHKNGVTEQIEAEVQCINYRPWKGFKFSIKEYVAERQEKLQVEIEE